MYKLISGILVLSFLNLIGCTSTNSFTAFELKQAEEDEPIDIHVITKDDQEYYFSYPNYYFENDTLYGRANTGSYGLDFGH